MAFYTIHPQEMQKIIAEKHAVVLDVRERESYLAYHYPQAMNFSYERLDDWLHYFPKGRVLVLYCEYGNTSLLAARRLAREGYEAYTVVGGAEAIRRVFP